jgi:hypothetical protein
VWIGRYRDLINPPGSPAPVKSGNLNREETPLKAVFNIRLTLDEKAEIERAAERDSRSLNNWCIYVLLKAARELNRLPPEA